MQKAIIFLDGEIEDLKSDIVESIIDFSKKAYGFKMVSRDTGEEITDIDQIHGMLTHPIDKAFSDTDVV